MTRVAILALINSITRWTWPGYLLKEMFNMVNAETRSWHFLSYLLFWSQMLREMVDKGSLKMIRAKFTMKTMILCVYDVQASKLRFPIFSHSILTITLADKDHFANKGINSQWHHRSRSLAGVSRVWDLGYITRTCLQTQNEQNEMFKDIR